MVHAFTSCGLLSTQYKHFSEAAMIGLNEQMAINKSLYFELPISVLI